MAKFFSREAVIRTAQDIYTISTVQVNVQMDITILAVWPAKNAKNNVLLAHLINLVLPVRIVN
jgi:hypothetical protein